MAWRILVIDDEPVNLEIIDEFLSDSGYDLALVESGAEGWNKLNDKSSNFDLVILDRMMPELDGLELLRRIKADERFHTIPVIMQTAAATPGSVAEGIEAGAYYYLTKPYEGRALKGIVRAAITEIEERRRAVERITQQWELSKLITHIDFEFKNIEQSQWIVGFLAGMCPNPMTAATGLSELLINAIEHGNLGITYEEKSRLKREGTWEEEIVKRQQTANYRDRVAVIAMDKDSNGLTFRIRDQGDGFKWERYLDFEESRACDPNGRGIAMARKLAFSQLEYRDRGNVVVATIEVTPS